MAAGIAGVGRIKGDCAAEELKRCGVCVAGCAGEEHDARPAYRKTLLRCGIGANQRIDAVTFQKTDGSLCTAAVKVSEELAHDLAVIVLIKFKRSAAAERF